MGNYLAVCGCEKGSNNYETAEDNTPKEGLLGESETKALQGTDNENAKTLSDIKVNKTSLIQKRLDDYKAHYIEDKKLGQGSFGLVKLVKTKVGNIPRAMKIISKKLIHSGSEEAEIQHEINILKCLDHPNIIKIYEFFEDKQNYYIINEFCDKGCLGDSEDDVPVYPEFMVKFVMKKVFSAIEYLNSMKMMHGDIKLENILVSTNTSYYGETLKTLAAILRNNKDLQKELTNINLKSEKDLSKEAKKFLKDLYNYEIKLADFGCARLFSKESKNESQKGVIGTLFYSAPELMRNEYCLASDQWALGVLMYFILTGNPPFDGNSEEEVIAVINANSINYNNKFLKGVSRECKDLMQKLIVTDPTKRITPTEALNHPFFKLPDAINDYLKSTLDMNSLLNLGDSDGDCVFKKIVINYIALNYIPKDEESKIKDVFRELAGEHSAKISRENFINRYTQIRDLSKEEAAKVFDRIDTDKNGTIEYQELVNAMSNKKNLLTKETLKEAFDAMDADGSGAISWEEISRIVFPGKRINQEVIDEFLKQIGKSNINEEVDFQSFCEIVTS